jgi:hypothetical protein
MRARGTPVYRKRIEIPDSQKDVGMVRREPIAYGWPVTPIFDLKTVQRYCGARFQEAVSTPQQCLNRPKISG